MRRNIPYVKYGGLKFLEAAHVKDLLAVLRWADNPKNRVAAFRALQLLPGVGPAGAERVFTAFEATGFRWQALKTSSAEFDELMQVPRRPEAPWPGQVQRVREWYAPHLERLYDAAEVRAGDLAAAGEDLQPVRERESTSSPSWRSTRPAPPATSRATPLLDEDYLVLSTVHSAKGQEWEAVHVLNVADGNFPSEFATGSAEQIEEERRLLYVAMTRAKTDLHLIAPLKYYVAQQSRMGDRHVYGAKSRFMTQAVLKCMEPVTYGDPVRADEILSAKSQVDVAGALRKMWM